MDNLELELWRRIAGLQQSVSHDFHHIQRVQYFTERLRARYGGNPEILTAAAILHDLGRGDLSRRHGLESIEASRELALSILQFIDLDKAKKDLILQAIDTHDQPDLHPQLLEARILKDADFLAGFGAWGVLRIAMWSGETGRKVEEVINKIGEGMLRRFDSLEFDLSRDLAQRELLVAQYFLAELAAKPNPSSGAYRGVYVVLEGISGSGKNTIAEQIRNNLSVNGMPLVSIEEPGDSFRDFRNVIISEGVDASSPPLGKALFMADRYLLMERLVKPGLTRGDLVVSVRSFLSTAVYQSETDADAYAIMLAHSWVPTCDLLIVLDLDAKVALERIKTREKPPGDYETENDLRKHRLSYHNYARMFNARNYRVVDAGKPKESVAEEVMSAIEGCLNSRQ